MKIANYVKRAAIAAESWNKLQAQKNGADKELKDEATAFPKIEDPSFEQTMEELIDNLATPITAVKGIQITKKQGVTEDLHNVA